MKIRRHSRVLLLAVALVPAGYLGSFGAAGGIPVAEGCSGSSPLGPDVNGFFSNGQYIVGTDGFFVISSPPSLDANQELAKVQADIRDSSGIPVPGALRVLDRISGQAGGFVYLGWTASTPLTDGAELAGTLRYESSAFSREFKLHVSGPPAVLPSPELKTGAWVRVTHGTGELITCYTNGTGSCNTSLTFGMTETTNDGVYATIAVPHAEKSVAWEFGIRASEGKASFAIPLGSTLLSSGGIELNSRILFAEARTEYCLEAVARDLRTSEERVSAPVCFAAGIPAETSFEYPLGNCLAPPRPELTRRWCELAKSGDRTPCRAGDADPDDEHQMPR